MAAERRPLLLLLVLEAPVAGVAVAVALLESWELALPLAALAVLVAGALVTSWWLRRPIPKGKPDTEEADEEARAKEVDEKATRFATLPETQIWVVVGAATSGVSLAAGVTVVQPWRHLFSDANNLARAVSVLMPIAALLVAVFLPRAMQGPELDLPYSLHRVAVFFVLGGLALFPAASGMLLVRSAALKADSSSLAVARRSLGDLVDQRRNLMLFLGIAAFIVFLAIVAQAALRRALLADGREYPAIFLLLSGSYFSVLIALLFVPAYVALQEAGRAAVDTLVPLSDAAFPRHEWFERQSDLRAFLGLDVSVGGLFSAAFAVLTPVVSSVLAAYVEKSGSIAADNPPSDLSRGE